MNYDSINEIFDAGITNMTCLLQNSSDYDSGSYAITGTDYFKFMGQSVPLIYAHGDSYWGFGSDVVHLSVNNRDARMRYLYREEGTLYNYYKFIKIRWEGTSHYNSSSASYQIKYDLLLWSTGDISLHMVTVPTSCYDGSFIMVADKNYSYTKPTSSLPDVTFQYYVENNVFHVKYTPIDFIIPFRLLVKDIEGKLYTIEKKIRNEETMDEVDILSLLDETELNSELFITKGFTKLPEWDLLKELQTPTVLSWGESKAYPLNAVITATPPKQCVECMADLSDGTVLGIKALNSEYTGKIMVQYSYDGVEYVDEISMADFLVMDLDALFGGLTDEKFIYFKFWLSGDATLTSFVMNYRNGDDDDAT